MSKELNFAEKTTFLFFIGFYFMQGALLSYLLLTYLLLPFFGIINPLTPWVSLIAGTLIILIIFFPFISYFLKEERNKNSIYSLIAGGLVYGANDFSCINGITDCLMKREKKWVPTNVKQNGKLNAYLMEACLGILLFVIPYNFYPSLLLLPCSYLFAGKFLFTPMLHFYYDNDKTNKIALPAFQYRTVFTALVFFVLFALPFAIGTTHVSRIVELKGKYIYVSKEKFIVKGIHYSPWRDGTGPNKNYPYPSPQMIEEDLNLVEKVNANTILVSDAPAYVLDIADTHHLMVIYSFSINWWSLKSGDWKKEEEKVLQKIMEFKTKPNILSWMLGNEIPLYLINNVGEDSVEKNLKELYTLVKIEDPNHFVTHSNWPPSKNLKFDFLDISGFNIYPVWPPEVVAHGYGNYISEVIQPIAGKRPLLVTEFGANSLESGEDGQARLTEQCWRELLKAGSSGGVVFDFADEWWKNYNNPIKPEQWWNRVDAPDDELKHDLDPEEYYGIMDSKRNPKPAYFTVQKMFAEKNSGAKTMVPEYIIGMLILVATAGGIWAWKRSIFKN